MCFLGLRAKARWRSPACLALSVGAGGAVLELHSSVSEQPPCPAVPTAVLGCEHPWAQHCLHPAVPLSSLRDCAKGLVPAWDSCALSQREGTRSCHHLNALSSPQTDVQLLGHICLIRSVTSCYGNATDTGAYSSGTNTALKGALLSCSDHTKMMQTPRCFHTPQM